MKPVRIGVLGTGTVVRGYHLPALIANARAQVVAVGNQHSDSLQALARDFGIAKTYDDLDRMADDPEIDAVVNALPNFLHGPVSVRMLQGCKHVLCEKPMAATVDAARSMVAAASATGRKLMIGHVWRASPEAQWLRDVVRAHTIGNIFNVKAHAIVARRGPRLESWFVRRETAGGGALADVGIHSIDTISFLFDDQVRPTRVSARIGNYFHSLDVEDTASALVDYDNGMTAQIEAGWYHSFAAEAHGAVELFGTEGYARTLPTRLHRRVKGVWSEHVPSFPSRHPDDDLPIYAAQIDRFLDCILDDHPPPCDGEQGLRNMIVLEAAYKSAATGLSVLPEFPATSQHEAIVVQAMNIDKPREASGRNQ